MEIKKEFLSSLFLFKNIENEIIDKCCCFDGYYVKEYNIGDVLQDFKSPQNIGIILSGKATIISGDDGVIIRKLIKDDIYGVAKLFDTTKYLTKIIAATKCSVLIISKEFVEKCINR